MTPWARKQASKVPKQRVASSKGLAGPTCPPASSRRRAQQESTPSVSFYLSLDHDELLQSLHCSEKDEMHA
jgi:hypothetical protein